ncbi:MAG TPA: GWxTD domain-containing protein [Bacteroidota bacterium]
MTSTLRKVALLSLVCAGLSFAQEEPSPQTPARYASTISFEVIPFFSPDSSTLVNVHYRVREDFFVVLRNIESLQPNDFVARGDLLVELKDEKGISVARDFRAIVIRKQRIPTEDDQPQDVQGSSSFRVPPGTYTVLFNVEDRQSERSYTSKDRTVTTRVPAEGEFEASKPMFVLPSSASGDSTVYTALNRSNDVVFGGSGGILQTLLLPSESMLQSVRHTVTLEPEMTNLDKSEFSGVSFVISDGMAVLKSTKGDTISVPSDPVQYHVHQTEGNLKSVYISLPLEQLHPGRAQVKVEFTPSGGAPKVFETSFRVFWPNKPVALRDLDMAIEALQHVATAAEMEGLRALSRPKAARRFEEFWRKKDPDTTTAYNEMMVEYYRRVDVANRQYSTGDEINGYKNDRGRIYILYGSPSDSQRHFSPSSPPREVWVYPNLKRRFVFEDQRRNGNYVLVAAENL